MIVELLKTVHATRPDIALLSRAVLEAIALSEGSIGSSSAVARALGIRNRFELARLLRRDGLPSLHRLADWATVMSWVINSKRRGVSLCRMAFHSRRHASACYRLVEDMTGLPWSLVRSRGLQWVIRRFARELRTSHARVHRDRIAS